MARPKKLTKKTQGEIIQAVGIGATLQIAADYAGISYNTLNNWRKRGEVELERLAKSIEDYEKLPDKEQKLAGKPEPIPEEKPFLEFFQALSEANAVAAVGWLQVIDTAASSDPTWAAWMLKQRYPEAYGGRVAEKTQGNLSLTGSIGGVPAELNADFLITIMRQADDELSRRTSPDIPGEDS